jgi:hypothetical protein
MVTRDRVLHLLAYDPETGEFRWRKSVNSRAPAGFVQVWCESRSIAGDTKCRINPTQY